MGKTDQDWFVNAAALVDTRLPPKDLWSGLMDVERRLGRVRAEKWGPRRIDLDLLFYGDRTIEEDDLVVPHPFLHLRRFVLEPLAELAADWIHPTLGLSVKSLAARLDPHEQEVFLL